MNPISPRIIEIPIKGLGDSKDDKSNEDAQMMGSGSSSSKDHAEVIEESAESKVIEEAKSARAATTPKTPTPEEYRVHRITHLPYRSWCPHCVKAKKRNPSHRRVGKDEKRRIPVVSMDYMFMNNKGEDHANPTLVVKDHFRGGVWAFMVIRKGSQTTFITQRVAGIISSLGYKEVIIKCDQEPAIKELQRDIREEMWKELKQAAKDIREANGDGRVQIEDGESVMVQNSPVGESQSNGVIERTIQSVQEQVRAIKNTIEEEASMKIDSTSHIWPWLIEYAAFTLYAFKIDDDDGLTALERTRGKATHQAIVAFGERVMYKPAKSVRVEKAEARWEDGVWLGVSPETHEHLIGTSRGVVKCRAISAVEESKKFDKNFIEEMKGLPWQPVPGRKSNRVPTQIREEVDDEQEDAEDEDEKQFEVQVEVEEDDTDEARPLKPELDAEARQRA
eukprot:5893899-Karenia_brevis.AAC.2